MPACRLLPRAVGQERHDVRKPEAAIAPAADAEERKLAAVAEALHGIDVEMEHLRNFARGEERSKLADGHSVPRLIGGRSHKAREVATGRVRPASWGSVGVRLGRAKPYLRSRRVVRRGRGWGAVSSTHLRAHETRH